MVIDFKGKVAVVTGGASGIGRACASEFVSSNAAVAIIDLDSDAGRQTVSDLRRAGGHAEYFQANVRMRDEVERLVPEIVTKLGGIDILVNNAGIQRYGTVTTITEEEWDEVLD